MDKVGMFESLWERIRSGFGIAGAATGCVFALLVGVLLIGEYICNYRLMLRSGSVTRRRALAIAVRYTFYYRFEISEYGLTVAKLLKRRVKGELVVPEGVAAIGRGALIKGTFSAVRLPVSLLSIGDDSLACNSLMVLHIPENVVSVGDGAFRDNRELRNVEMPFVPDMRFTAFEGCGKLQTVTVSGNELVLARFGGSGFNFLLWYISAVKLAGEGGKEALSYVLGNSRIMMELFVSQESISNILRLFSLPMPLPRETVDSAIETAVKNEKHEIYIMLVQYKRDRLGFTDSDDPDSRFEL